jgi:hypothetical protein
VSGELHDVSLQIGRLLESQEESSRGRVAMSNKIDDVHSAVHELTSMMKDFSRNHDDLKRQVQDEIVPVVREFVDLKSKGAGIMIGVGLAAGGVGAGLTKVLHYFGFNSN